MKKLSWAIAAFAAILTLQSSAFECDFSVWPGFHEASGSSNLRFGLPLSVGGGKVSGAELSLFYSGSAAAGGLQFTLIGLNKTNDFGGIQLALVNMTDSMIGAQLGAVNMTDRANGLQFGGVNVAQTVDGLQFGLVNFASNAQVQLGLLNFNKNGFLPLFIIINLSDDLF